MKNKLNLLIVFLSLMISFAVQSSEYFEITSNSYEFIQVPELRNSSSSSYSEMENIIFSSYFLQNDVNLEQSFEEVKNLRKGIFEKESHFRNRRLQFAKKTLRKFYDLDLKTEEVVRRYSSRNYQNINNCLRKTEGCNTGIQKDIDILDQLFISRSRRLNNYFRGTALPESVIKKIEYALKNNQAVIIDSAFMSSSTKLSVAKNYASTSAGISALLVFVTKNGFPISFLSHFIQEDEVLLPRSFELNILEVKKRSDVCGKEFQSRLDYKLIIASDVGTDVKVTLGNRFFDEFCEQ